MQLSKMITVKFRFCKSDWMKYEVYRNARNKYHLSVHTLCQWCKYKFKDDDIIGLAGPEADKNIIVCRQCAKAILESKDE